MNEPWTHVPSATEGGDTAALAACLAAYLPGLELDEGGVAEIAGDHGLLVMLWHQRYPDRLRLIAPITIADFPGGPGLARFALQQNWRHGERGGYLALDEEARGLYLFRTFPLDRLEPAALHHWLDESVDYVKTLRGAFQEFEAAAGSPAPAEAAGGPRPDMLRG